METWNQFLLIFVAIAAMAVLIGLAVNYFRINLDQETMIEGDKQFVIGSILRKVYKCYDDNVGRKESVICNEFLINCTQPISSSDITGGIDSSKLENSSLVTVDIASKDEIIIRYENQIVYIEKVEHERISP